MNRRLSKSKCLLVPACILLILISVFCSITANFVKLSEENVRAETVVPDNTSIINISGSGDFKDNFSNILEGAQKENVYFGKNGSSVLKWRVLSSNDTRYSNGKVLLWADKSIVSEVFNSGSAKDFAFWATSHVRASLNGGEYLNSSANGYDTLNIEDSWFNKIFGNLEQECVILSNEYQTKLFGYNSGGSPFVPTTNIISESSSRYSETIINGKGGIAAEKTADNGVVEKTSDKLFLLDYYDINNLDYGFGDNGKSYANLISASYDINTANNYLTSSDSRGMAAEYLKGENYWLRVPGRVYDSPYALNVNAGGYIYVNWQTPSLGLRPAFAFDSNKVVYATASEASSSTTLTPVSSHSGTPSYKLYIKGEDASYNNYNIDKNNAPQISSSNGNITVTKSGQSGSAIILLTDKEGNGKVYYQAITQFNGGVATATIPSGENVNNYAITVLFADNLNGGNNTEIITGHYTMSGVAIPKDVTVEYNGLARTVEDLIEEAWYDSTIYGDESRMSISMPADAVHQGSYSIKFSIKDSDLKWEDETTTDKTINLIIESKPIGLTWTSDDNGIYKAAPNASDLCDVDKEKEIIVTRYRSRGTTTEYDSLTPPKRIGDYRAIAESNNKDYVISESSQKSQDFTLEALRVPILASSNFSPSNIQSYTGKDRTFELINYDYKWKGSAGDSSVEISIPARYAGKIMIDQDNYIIVKEAGTYALQLELTDTENSRWADKSETAADRTAPREVEFKVTQKSLNGEIVSGIDEDGIIKAVVGNNVKVMFEMAELPFAGDNISIDIYAYKSGSSNSTLLKGNIIVSQADGEYSYQVDLNTSALRIAGQYMLKFELRDKINTANSNYELLIEDVELALTEEVDEGSITWRLKEGNILIDSTRTPIGEFSMSYAPTNIIKYNKNKIYKFEVRTPSGYVVDTVTEDGFVNGYKNTDFDGNIIEMCKDASKYTTQVRIKNILTQEVQIYEIKWEITKAKYDLSQVKWKGNGRLEYNGQLQEMILENLPEGLEILSYIGDEQYRDVTTSALHVAVEDLDFTDEAYEKNYVLPIVGDSTTYIGNVVWETDWSIVPKEIKVQWSKELLKDKYGNSFNIAILRSKEENTVVVHKYYKSDGKGNKVGEAISESDIVVPESGTEYYICELTLSSNDGYILTGTTIREFAVSNQGSAVKFTPNKLTFAYTGEEIKLWLSNDGNLKSSQYKVTYYSAGGASPLTSAPMSVGKYRVEITLNDELNGKYFIGGDSEWEIEIVARIINESWNTTSKPPRLNINKTELGMIEYEFMDEEGNVISYDQMKSKAGVYSVRAKIKGTYIGNCSFASGNNETEWIDFELTENDLANMQDPNDPTLYPDDPDMQEPEEPDDNNPSGDINSGNNPSGDVSGDVPTNPEDKGGVDFDKISKILKEWWQVIASGISIVLIIIFMAKTAGYESRRKKANKKIEKYESAVYAATTGLFGLATTAWTAIACILMGLAVLSFVIMLIAKNRCNKSEDSLEEAKEDYERNKENNRRDYDDNRRDEEYRRRDEEYRQREEDMKAMFMRMMGGYDFNNMGQPQGAYMGAQQGIGAEEIRGIVSETVTALLPGMQQALPQQASVNDELMQKLIEKEEQNDKTITKLIEQNERLMQDNAENQKVMQSLMQQLANKEATATNVNDELVNRLIEQNDKLMQRLAEQQPQQVVTSQPQIIEKIVEKPVEKIVEKEVRVEVPVEKIVEVPVETVVEKVVEKPIVISTEAVGEAEKSKQVKKTPSPKKAPAPRLTLEEAYAKLTKEQKKYFDGLREYAMSKDSKCKEKLSTYFTTIGPSTINPFIKLTIKKGITVALFKMEDEYLKDIRRNASGDGTKVKVKETEVPIGDKQAYDTAKDMVDLRIDQIDRYNDFLKEQRALRKS